MRDGRGVRECWSSGVVERWIDGGRAFYPVDAFHRIEELMLDRGERWLGSGGQFRAGEGETANGRGDFQGAGDLGQSHPAQVFLAEGFEEALSGGEEFLGGIPFLVAEAIEAGGPVGGLTGVEGGLGFSLLLKEAGVEVQDAIRPIKPAGPVFDRAERCAEAVGDGLEGAGVAELEEGQEGAEGARGLAGGTGEGGLRDGRGVRECWSSGVVERWIGGDTGGRRSGELRLGG